MSQTNKIQQNKDTFTIFQSKYPVFMPLVLRRKIQNISEKIARVFKLKNCPILIQAIINENDIYIVEFSARIGGGSKYKLIEYMSGIDIMNVYVNRILGDENQVVNPTFSNKYIELNYIYTYKGIFSKLLNFKKFIKNRQIKEFFRYKEEGDFIENRMTSSDRIAGFLIEEDRNDMLLKIRKNIVEEIDVINDSGKSIMYKECFY